MTIDKITTYRDGGTTSIRTDIGEYCVNHQIGADETKGMLFEGTPATGRKLDSVEAKQMKKQINGALKTFKGSITEWESNSIKNIKL
jgi:hypothetical protein